MNDIKPIENWLASTHFSGDSTDKTVEEESIITGRSVSALYTNPLQFNTRSGITSLDYRSNNHYDDDDIAPATPLLYLENDAQPIFQHVSPQQQKAIDEREQRIYTKRSSEPPPWSNMTLD